MPQVIFLTIVFYLLYRLVFDLIIPVFRTTRQVKRQFNEMHEHMQQTTGTGPDQQQARPERPQSNPKAKVGDYIDFEEIKS